MAEQDKSQRTERPTPYRLKKARERGQVPRSNEVSGALGLAALLVYAWVFGGGWMSRLGDFLADSFSSLGMADLDPDRAVVALGSVGASTAALLLPPLAVMMFAGVGGNLIQGQLVFTFKPLQPDFKKINPFQGIKKVFSLRKWVEMAKALVKMVLYSVVAVGAIRDALTTEPVGAPGAEGALAALLELTGKVLLRIVVLAAGLAVVDVLFRRYDHVRGLRMTKKEVRDERKEQEGDPHVRARMRSRQMALARTRMMAAVPNATVVVTNPTHVAVALRYEPGQTDVPQLLAKGRGKIAERIREIASEHRIPIVSDPPLARLLYRSVPVGGSIPAALYRAVAELLALVFRRDGRGARP